MAYHEIYHSKLLLDKVSAGDEQAFSQLVAAYGKNVFAFVQLHCRNRELAEEIVQDVFTQVWLTREGLGEINNFEGFLYVLSRNYAYDALRKMLRNNKKQIEYNQQVSPALSEEINGTEDDNWKVNLVEMAVNTLPPQQKMVWQLIRRDGLKRAEVAERMNLSQETVKKYLHYATASIIKYIERLSN